MPHKFRAYVAGFGSGKTYVGCAGILVHHSKFPKVNSAYYAPTYKLVKDVFWPTIDEVAYIMGFQTRIKVGDSEVIVKRNGKEYGVINCRTMDNPANIVGFKSGHALIDELDIMPTAKAKLAWRKILARMRYKVPGLRNGVDVTTTPEDFKFTYERFVKDGGEQYGLVKASTYDNEINLPDDYISTLVADYPEEYIHAYIKGEFINLLSGTVYKNYDRILHRSKETIRPKEALYIGMDFNVTKMAATVYVQRNGGKEWHAVEEIKNGYDTPEMIQTLVSRYPGHKITIYPDATGKNRKSIGASTSDIAMLRGAGYTIKAKESNPMVKDRVLATNSAFTRGVLLVNDRACPTVADNFEQQAYNDNGEPDKKSGHDHQNDASTYPIAYEMPIRKPIANIKVRMPT